MGWCLVKQLYLYLLKGRCTYLFVCTCKQIDNILWNSINGPCLYWLTWVHVLNYTRMAALRNLEVTTVCQPLSQWIGQPDIKLISQLDCLSFLLLGARSESPRTSESFSYVYQLRSLSFCPSCRHFLTWKCTCCWPRSRSRCAGHCARV